LPLEDIFKTPYISAPAFFEDEFVAGVAEARDAAKIFQNPHMNLKLIEPNTSFRCWPENSLLRVTCTQLNSKCAHGCTAMPQLKSFT
jgi:hypothetical protein